MEPKLYDKTGREIMVGDVLKVFHFIGPRRKRYYMYKRVTAKGNLENSGKYLVIDHLTSVENPKEYYEAMDDRVLNTVEIVQGFGTDGTSFEHRSRIKQSEEPS